MGLEGAIAVSSQNRYGVVVDRSIDNHEIRNAIPSDVADRKISRIPTPDVIQNLGLKCPVGIAEHNRDAVCILIGNRQIQNAVVVQVCGDNLLGVIVIPICKSRRVSAGCLKRAVAVSELHGCLAGAFIGRWQHHREVELAIAVEISRGDATGNPVDCDLALRIESPVALSEQNRDIVRIRI